MNRRRSARSSGWRVPVRLEVVDLGEHELVFRLAARHLEVRAHQVEPVGLPAPAGRVLGPQAGVGGLGVPPHRVVVEVADHVHRPAGLGDGELERCCVPSASTRAAAARRARVANRDGHLDDAVAGPADGGVGVVRPSPSTRIGRRAAGIGDPHQLQRRIRRPDEQLRRLRGDDAHANDTLRRHGREMSTTSAR